MGGSTHHSDTASCFYFAGGYNTYHSIMEEEEQQEEPMDLSLSRGELERREMERFAREVKRRRLELGLTQGDVGAALGRTHGNDFSQTTISRFEAGNLSDRNMRKLKPMLEAWLEGAGAAAPGGGRVTPVSNPGSVGSSTSSLLSVTSLPSYLSVSPHGSVSRRRKKRTSIDMGVRNALERSFGASQRPSPEEISALADSLSMDKEVVRVWFCNRRQKEKKRPSVLELQTFYQQQQQQQPHQPHQ